MLKLPIFATDQGDNYWGIGLTLGLFAAGNYAAYRNLVYMQSKKPIFERQEYKVAFGVYT